MSLFDDNEVLHQFTQLLPPPVGNRPLAQVRLLLTLLDYPDLTPSTVAQQWQVTRAAATKALRPLFEQRLIAKTINQSDKRSYTIALTDSGRALAQTLAATYLAPIARLHQGLGDAAYRDLITRVAAANRVLTAAAQTPAP